VIEKKYQASQSGKQAPGWDLNEVQLECEVEDSITFHRSVLSCRKISISSIALHPDANTSYTHQDVTLHTIHAATVIHIHMRRPAEN
jgi:pterin-4a-carbinolamine dehydratase